LRVYWYDGVSNKGPTEEHSRIAHCPNVKLRLGFINSVGQQKGVDSLIVTDLVELARNKAISSAVLVSGNEDTRIGVQIAQSFGVRIHLLGIEPARASQSMQLMQEADTRSELSKNEVATFIQYFGPDLTLSVVIDSGTGVAKNVQPNAEPGLHHQIIPDFRKIAKSFIDTKADSEIEIMRTCIVNINGIPQEIDRKLLGTTRDIIGRDLNQKERKSLREFAKIEAAFRLKI